MPCADGLMSACTSQTNIENVSNESDHNHSEDHEDDCTPFCTCICCGSVIGFPQTVETPSKQNSFLLAKISFHYDFHYIFDYKDGVWRPPTNC